MDVPTPYLINDTRRPELFKKTTFSNYLKKDVFQTIIKSFDNGNVSDACLWSCECIISGYLDELWDKCLEYYTKYININSPFLPYHLYQKLVLLLRLKKTPHFSKNMLDLRNCQEVRNHIAELMCLMSHATKSRKSFPLPKISKKDFENAIFKDKLVDAEIYDVKNIIVKQDPPELECIAHTFAHYLQEKTYSLPKSVYWVFWLIEWEKLMTLKFGHYSCAKRNLILNVDEKVCQDFIWILWSIILKEGEKKYNNSLSQQMKSLFEFFKFKYTSSKKRKRIYYLINSIQLLDPNLEFNRKKYPIFENYHITLQACLNINIVYQYYKKDETVSRNYQNSKTKLDASYVITKHEDISQLGSLSEYRLKLKEQKQQEKEHKEFLAKKKLEKRKSKEERQALKKHMLEKIDNHIINNSHKRPVMPQYTSSSPIKTLTTNDSESGKTIHILEKLDKKLKIKDETPDGMKSNLKKIDKSNAIFTVIKTD